MGHYYIGLASTCHEPAFAIIDPHGEVIFAEATERYLQNKRAWNCFPDDMVRCEKIIKEYLNDCTELTIATSWTKGYFRKLKIVSNIFNYFGKYFMDTLNDK